MIFYRVPPGMAGQQAIKSFFWVENAELIVQCRKMKHETHLHVNRFYSKTKAIFS